MTISTPLFNSHLQPEHLPLEFVDFEVKTLVPLVDIREETYTGTFEDVILVFLVVWGSPFVCFEDFFDSF
jgi:hypothetical protein